MMSYKIIAPIACKEYADGVCTINIPSNTTTHLFHVDIIIPVNFEIRIDHHFVDPEIVLGFPYIANVIFDGEYYK